MKNQQYEYKYHYLQLKVGRNSKEQLLEALNAFGKEGWRLNQLRGEVGFRSLAFWKGGPYLLLEREIEL